ncbi:MAG: hypothetical protein P1V51_08500 [Deltaproteobacteria bacterium]|nr:hypothetical protein [Deltaproteobacteria bacterium]
MRCAATGSCLTLLLLLSAACPATPEAPRGVKPAAAGATKLAETLCISDERFRLGETAAEAEQRAWHLDRFEELAVGTLRHDLRWRLHEPAEGELHWEPFDAGIAEIASRGLEMIGILDYGVAWASSQTDTDSAFPPDDPADFAAYAGRMAARYGDRVRTLEIWNEQNSGFRFWKPQEDPAAYAELLHQAAAAVRGERPEARVVYGGLFFHEQVITGALPFLQAHLEAHPHAGEDFDAFAFHPYPLYPPTAPPEGADEGQVPVDEMVEGVQGVLDEHGLEHPLVVTEFGWPVYGEVSGELQAAYLARETLWLLASGVELACWFTMIDGRFTGTFPPEDDFGLFAWDPTTGEVGDAKPAWHAMNTLSHELGGLAFVEWIDDALGLGNGAHALLLADETGTTWAHALWSLDDRFAGEVVVPVVEGASLRAVNALGVEVPFERVAGGARVAYGALPVYLLGELP